MVSRSYQQCPALCLMKFRLDEYSWREQEQIINDSLPQYRLTLSLPSSDNNTKDDTLKQSLRIHYVHKRSSAKDAIALLYVHGYPGSFLEVSKILDPLTSTIPTHLNERATSFHVVAPSIPGFGFSDAATNHDFAAKDTALWWDALMKRLGYDQYVVASSVQGWAIARWLITGESGCVAAHRILSRHDLLEEVRPMTAVRDKKGGWLSFKRTKKSKEEEHSTSSQSLQELKSMVESKYLCPSPLHLPQTVAHGLCDSPVGLLASVLSQLYDLGHLHLWSQTDVLNWTMLQWLPGPEAALRWSWATQQEDSGQIQDFPVAQLGVTIYDQPQHVLEDRSNGPVTMDQPTGVRMADSTRNVAWTKKRTGRAGIPAFDSPADVIVDLRNFVSRGQSEGWLRFTHDASESINVQQPQESDAQDLAEATYHQDTDLGEHQEVNPKLEDEVSRESRWGLIWRWFLTNLNMRHGRHRNHL